MKIRMLVNKFYGAANKRGINRNVRLEREVRARKREDPSNTETFKPLVHMPQNELNPVGDWSANFVREVGSLIRQHAPIRVKSWKHILPRKKDELVQMVMVCIFSSHIYFPLQLMLDD